MRTQTNTLRCAAGSTPTRVADARVRGIRRGFAGAVERTIDLEIHARIGRNVALRTTPAIEALAIPGLSL
jgi:hypothetical protein